MNGMMTCASIGYSASLIYFKTPLDDMREARAWLEGVREKRETADKFIWDWPVLDHDPIAYA